MPQLQIFILEIEALFQLAKDNNLLQLLSTPAALHSSGSPQLQIFIFGTFHN